MNQWVQDGVLVSQVTKQNPESEMVTSQSLSFKVDKTGLTWQTFPPSVAKPQVWNPGMVGLSCVSWIAPNCIDTHPHCWVCMRWLTHNFTPHTHRRTHHHHHHQHPTPSITTDPTISITPMKHPTTSNNTQQHNIQQHPTELNTIQQHQMPVLTLNKQDWMLFNVLKCNILLISRLIIRAILVL